MDDVERLMAIEEIKQVKAAYFRGVDTGDGDLVRSILAEDCELDYVGSCTDPATGVDYLPSANRVVRGRESWPSGRSGGGLVSVHQGHTVEVDVTSDTTARAVWSMSDRLFFPAGAPLSRVTGYGHYHDTYERVDGAWKLKTTRLTRLRVEGA